MNEEGAMLSRIAAHLYWAGRQVMRAEDISRAVIAHNAVSLTARRKNANDGAILLAALEQPFSEKSEKLGKRGKPGKIGEEAVLRHLTSSRANPNSVRSCVRLARENMRAARAMLPEEIWAQITHLNDAVNAAAAKRGRRERVRELRDVILQCRAIVGVLLTTLRRGGARAFLNIGILMECAEMDCRILRYALLPDDEQADDSAGVDSVRWRHLLDAFGLANMYRSGGGHFVIRRDWAVDFIVADTSVPRSLIFCLRQLQALFSLLPNNAKILEECARAQKAAATVRGAGADPAEKLERAQTQIQKLHAALMQTYFSA